LSEEEWKHIWKLKILHERFKKLLWKIALELDALHSKKCPKQEMASRYLKFLTVLCTQPTETLA